MVEYDNFHMVQTDIMLSSHFSELAETWVVDGTMAPKTGISQGHFSHQEGSSLNRSDTVWATMIHPVSHGGWFQQKPRGQEKQIQIQKEIYSSEGEALLFHDGVSLV